MGNKNIQLVLQHCYKTSWIAVLHVLPPTNQPVLQQIRLMQVAKSCCTKSLHVVHFTDPRQTCFAASSWGNSRVQHDSRAILSNHKSVFRQLAMMKHVALLFNSFGSDVAKQVGRFCSGFYRSFTSLGGIRQYHYQCHFFVWHSVSFIMIHSSVMQGLLSSVFSHVLNINESSWNVSFRTQCVSEQTLSLPWYHRQVGNVYYNCL